MFYENTITALQSITQIITGAQDGVRTLVLAAPRAPLAWNAPSHRLTEDQAKALLGGSYPSTVISADPSLKTGHTHQAAVGVDRAWGADLTVSVNAVYVRGLNQPGTIDYNPALPAVLGTSRRPNDLPCSANPAATCINGGIPGSSASILQYSSFGDSWYKGMTLAVSKRPSHTSRSSSCRTRCRKPKTRRPISRATSSRRTTASAAIRTTSSVCRWASTLTSSAGRPRTINGSGS